MANWLVREDSEAIDISQNQTTFRIRGRRRPRLMQGDVIVVYSRVRIPSFSMEGVVSHIETKAVGGDPPLFDTKVTVEQWNKLRHETTVEDLAYSLQIVRKPKTPYLYFRLPYRGVADEDLETIRNGELYVARHAYNLLIDALPPLTRARFNAEQLVLEADGLLKVSRLDFQSRLQTLCAFLDSSLMPIGNLLSALIREIEACKFMTSDEKPIDHFLGYGDSSAPLFADDSIFEQGKLFAQLDQAIEGMGRPPGAARTDAANFHSVLQAIEQIGGESGQQRFAQLFEDDPL